MVIEDSFTPPKKKNSKSHAGMQIVSIASPVDRLAAFVGEIPVFVPLASVFLAPFHHDISIAQMTGSQVQFFYACLGIAATLFAFLIAYQTLFIYFFGATPGKYFVGLRVVSVFGGGKPTFTMSLLRSVALCFEILLLGFPWVASISQQHRRVLHDRLSDTYVKCLDDKKAAVAPLLVEKQLAKNIQAPGWALLFLAIAAVVTYFGYEHQELSLVKELETNDQLCAEVSSAFHDWGSKIETHPSRVSVALALYESRAITETCLEKEAQYSLWRNQNKDMGYLALALSHSRDDETFFKYIDKVCLADKDGDACQYANMIEINDSVDNLRQPASIPGEDKKWADIKTEFMNLHIERELHEQNQLQDALKMIDQSAATPHFASYLNLERIKMMWEMDRMHEARAVYEASRAHLNDESRLQLSSWMCSAEVLSGCSVEGRNACGEFITDYERTTDQTDNLELSYIKAQKCVNQDGMDYANIDKKLSSDRAHDYLTAVELVGDRKLSGAKAIFKQIADDSDSDEFQAQAIADLVEISQSKIELDFFFEEFLSNEYSQVDPRFAFGLFHKYLALGDFEKVSSVGENILKTFPYKTSVYARLFEEAKKHKNSQFAKKIQSQFKKMRPDMKSLESAEE